ncbi:MAG: hypothetical protein EBZ77_14505, partial [Chitinophagia bacterium]|nr:hypothetical protein [Chitinophagia bacterium]
MKKALLLFLSVVAVAGSLLAQPTLTAATNSPVAGDVFFSHTCDTTGVRTGATGASVTWNFAGLSATGSIDTFGLVPCSATPYCGMFPGSSLASPSGGGSDFTYFKSTSTTFEAMGNVSTMDTTVFSDPEVQTYFPMTYNSGYYDTSLVIGTGYQYRFHDSFRCDGWGTLVLPTGTYNNVLRIRQTTTMLIDIFGFTTSSSWDTYTWYRSGFHFPLLSVSCDTTGPTQAPANVAYYTNFTTAVPDASPRQTAMRIYPNPASQTLTIEAATGARYDIINNIGSVVATG